MPSSARAGASDGECVVIRGWGRDEGTVMRLRGNSVVLLIAGVVTLGCSVLAVGRAVATRQDDAAARAPAPGPTAPSLLPTVAPAAGAATTATVGAPVAVQIVEFAFQPATLTVKVGGTVTWTNADSFAHSIWSNDATFDEQRMDKGATATVTFAKLGSYAYICGIHNSMTGTVVVEP